MTRRWFMVVLLILGLVMPASLGGLHAFSPARAGVNETTLPAGGPGAAPEAACCPCCASDEACNQPAPAAPAPVSERTMPACPCAPAPAQSPTPAPATASVVIKAVAWSRPATRWARWFERLPGREAPAACSSGVKTTGRAFAPWTDAPRARAVVCRRTT